MTYYIITLFPELIDPYFTTGVYRHARERGLIDYKTVALRTFATDTRGTCDDNAYGPGRGMVLSPEPLARALDSVNAAARCTVYPSPAGVPLDDQLLARLSNYSELVFICGRYEGIDQRIIDTYVDIEIGIGDYVISSGELASLVIIDGITRLVPNVIHPESLKDESFSNRLLEYPHYTRPEVWRGHRVPEVLLSGHHHNIAHWRRGQSVQKTLRNRRDILEKP